MSRLFTIMALLAVSASVPATEVYRCTQANGITTFSQRPCGPDAVVERVPQSSSHDHPAKTSPSAIEQLENYRQQVKKIRHITGSHSRQQSTTRSGPCDQVTSLELRNARVSKHLMACQSMNDVRNIYGAPHAVSTWSNHEPYDTRWLYRQDDDGRVYVFFKEGRVTRWNTHSN